MKQEAGAHKLLLQEHLLPERNVHLALIVSQPIKEQQHGKQIGAYDEPKEYS